LDDIPTTIAVEQGFIVAVIDRYPRGPIQDRIGLSGEGSCQGGGDGQSEDGFFHGEVSNGLKINPCVSKSSFQSTVFLIGKQP
jgi:hypothetical protein